jgi:hypothetical protein
MLRVHRFAGAIAHITPLQSDARQGGERRSPDGRPYPDFVSHFNLTATALSGEYLFADDAFNAHVSFRARDRHRMGAIHKIADKDGDRRTSRPNSQ